MRSDVLSNRIFLAGCFGLPWLWIVHILYERGLEEKGGDPDAAGAANQGLLDADEHFPEEATTLSPQQIAEERKSWVAKCKAGAITVCGAWLAWIIVAQALRPHLPATLFVYNQDDGDFTGW